MKRNSRWRVTIWQRRGNPATIWKWSKWYFQLNKGILIKKKWLNLNLSRVQSQLQASSDGMIKGSKQLWGKLWRWGKKRKGLVSCYLAKLLKYQKNDVSNRHLFCYINMLHMWLGCIVQLGGNCFIISFIVKITINLHWKKLSFVFKCRQLQLFVLYWQVTLELAKKIGKIIIKFFLIHIIIFPLLYCGFQFFMFYCIFHTVNIAFYVLGR